MIHRQLLSFEYLEDQEPVREEIGWVHLPKVVQAGSGVGGLTSGWVEVQVSGQVLNGASSLRSLRRSLAKLVMPMSNVASGAVIWVGWFPPLCVYKTCR